MASRWSRVCLVSVFALVGCGGDAEVALEEGDAESDAVAEASADTTVLDDAPSDANDPDTQTQDTGAQDTRVVDGNGADVVLSDVVALDTQPLDDGGTIDLDGGVIENAGGVIDLDGGVTEDSAVADSSTTDSSTPQDSGTTPLDSGADTRDGGQCVNTEVAGAAQTLGCATTTFTKTGGTIPAGRYVLTQVRRMANVCGDAGFTATVASAMTIVGTSTQTYSRVRTIQLGTGAPQTFRDSGGLTTNGTTFTLGLQCPVGSTPRSGTYSFVTPDAGASQLRLDLFENGVRLLYVYTLQ